MKFSFTHTETVLYHKWQAEHNAKCLFFDDGTEAEPPVGAIGGTTTYSFTPTSLGVVVKVRCACGVEIDLTDYKNW